MELCLYTAAKQLTSINSAPSKYAFRKNNCHVNTMAPCYPHTAGVCSWQSFQNNRLPGQTLIQCILCSDQVLLTEGAYPCESGSLASQIFCCSDQNNSLSSEQKAN